jgi:AcrR family transcriptional regulator
MPSNVVSDNNVVNGNIQGVASRPYHHGNLRTELLERAEAVLAGGGELSLRELARAAGVSHAAPRRHFPDKQALLDALALDGFARLERALAEAIAGAGPAFAARLTALARAYVRFATGHPALLDLMFAGKHDPAASSALAAAADRAFVAPLALVADGQRSGDVVPGDPQRVATATWAALHGLAGLAGRGMLDGDLDAVIGDAVDQLLDGLRPRAA